jgi:L-threonylcarbamoyladenylate synthase
MKYKTEIGTSVEKAAGFLREGHLVAIPTETVYGLAGNALNPDAVVQIFETKERPLYNPLIVHDISKENIQQYTTGWTPPLEKLVQHCWPGPLTLLLPRKETIPDLVSAGLPDVAVRIPDHPLTLELIHQCAFPLAAPSANLFSRLSPTSVEHVFAQLEGRIPYILDGGPCTVGLESTIMGMNSEGQWCIYRPGAFSKTELSHFLGEIAVASDESTPRAPGMLPLHYAPRTPLVFGPFDQTVLEFNKKKQGFLCFEKPYAGAKSKHLRVLSLEGNLQSAARALYASLHYLDSLNLETIYAEPVPDQGLGKAINDRLKRAANQG